MHKIKMNGKEYEVIEDLGYQYALRAKVIMYEGKERIVVRDYGNWRLWSITERIAPFLSHPPKE